MKTIRDNLTEKDVIINMLELVDFCLNQNEKANILDLTIGKLKMHFEFCKSEEFENDD